MCGIAALFAYAEAAPPVDRGELAAIVERMRPRGPDGGGTWLSADGRAGLGARRLAIIDLSPEGDQPMTDAAGELHIVFNGEIYNHDQLRARLQRFGVRFRSTSDTEVLMELYRHDGERMIELLRGMFAFAIWDARARRMFIGRDPYGIKPLYVADDGATFRAASTVKALLAGGRVARAIDPAGAAGFFLTGSVPEPFTIFDGIKPVEPGSSLVVDARGMAQPRRFYSVAAPFARGLDQPTIDGTNTWFVSKAAAEAGLKVAISGVGGDELFGSYPSFRDVPRMVRANAIPPLGAMAARVMRNPKAKYFTLGRTWAGAYFLKRGLFMPDDLPALLGTDVAEEGLKRLDLLCRIDSALEP